jgi:WD40 repeat protein
MRICSCVWAFALACAAPLLVFSQTAPQRVTGSKLTLSGHTGNVTSVAYRPDGQQIASASQDATVRVWDANTGTVLKTLIGHGTAVLSVAYSPDGTRIVSSSFDGTARVWDIDTSQAVVTFTGHGVVVLRAYFLPDGKRVVSAGGDQKIKIWDAATGEERRSIHCDPHALSIAVSPDGRQLASGHNDSTIRIWDLEKNTDPRIMKSDDGPVYVLAFSSDGKRLVTGGAYTGQPVMPAPGAGPIPVTGFARVWDVQGGRSLAQLRGHDKAVSSVCFSPDGKSVASAGQEGTVRLWDAASGASLTVFAGHEGMASAVAFRPDGKQIVSSGLDSLIKIWDVSPGGAPAPTTQPAAPTTRPATSETRPAKP